MHRSENGYSEIWRIDRGGRFRVLKSLKEEYRGDTLYENLLRKEFEIGYSLDHYNICEYYGFRKVEGLGNCIEMEWIDGRNLEEMISSGTVDKETALKIAGELCDALSYMHSKQVYHRDLKPANILVTFKGNTVKLIDFGFSDSDCHSMLKNPAGTINYTAPEVLRDGTYDARSDIYSLGLVLYRLSRRFARVARKCWAERPGARYQSAEQVKRAINSNSGYYAGLAFIAVAVIFVLLPLFQPDNQATVEPVPSVLPADTVHAVKDTVLASPSSVAAPSAPGKEDIKTAPAAKNVAEEHKVDTSAIDELFRQATDLFE